MISIALDFILKTAERDGRKVRLTPSLLRLLHELRMAAPGFARLDHLMESLWQNGDRPADPGRAMHCQIRNLRRAIVRINLDIENRISWGYRLVEATHAKQADQATARREATEAERSA